MRFQVGKVYHQQYANGDRSYFQPLSLQINGRWHGFRIEGRGKPKQCSCDESLTAWIETPAADIPAKFRTTV